MHRHPIDFVSFTAFTSQYEDRIISLFSLIDAVSLNVGQFNTPVRESHCSTNLFLLNTAMMYTIFTNIHDFLLYRYSGFNTEFELDKMIQTDKHDTVFQMVFDW